jgi:hypothetical protein
LQSCGVNNIVKNKYKILQKLQNIHQNVLLKVAAFKKVAKKTDFSFFNTFLNLNANFSSKKRAPHRTRHTNAHWRGAAQSAISAEQFFFSQQVEETITLKRSKVRKAWQAFLPSNISIFESYFGTSR